MRLALMFGAVASDDRVGPLYLFEADLKINTEEYLKILKRGLVSE